MKEDLRDAKPMGRNEANAPKRPTTLPDDVGLAERFLATGRDAGFDMTSQEGVAAWSSEIKQRIMRGDALETSVPRADSPESPAAQRPDYPPKDRKPR